MSDLPNILYLHSHDTGRYIQPYGHAVDTPHMQRFAEQGVLFRQAFCAAPTCSPSRACLLTGQSAHSSGMFGLAHRGWSLNDYGQHLIHPLKAAGYHTALCGVQHIAHGDDVAGTIGYDERLEGWSETAPDHVAKFLGRDHDKPFFLAVGFIQTHRTKGGGHNGTSELLGDPRYVSPPAPLPDTPQTRADFADYAVCVNRLDSYYGRILDALDKAGLADNTIVIITTDHGIAYPAMKCNLTDHGMGVLMMMRGPERMGLSGGDSGGGRVIDSMVSHIDVYPTLCDLLGIDKPGHLQGRSMMPLLLGEVDVTQPDALNDEVFAEVTYHAAYEPKRAVRTARYKYIRNFFDRDTPILANCDGSPSREYWLGQGWADRPVTAGEQLYDLVFDPNESNNLADDPAYAQTLADMRGRLDAWMQRTSDPILDGPIPLSTTGRTNTWAQRSASEDMVAADAFDVSNP